MQIYWKLEEWKLIKFKFLLMINMSVISLSLKNKQTTVVFPKSMSQIKCTKCLWFLLMREIIIFINRKLWFGLYWFVFYYKWIVHRNFLCIFLFHLWNCQTFQDFVWFWSLSSSSAQPSCAISNKYQFIDWYCLITFPFCRYLLIKIFFLSWFKPTDRFSLSSLWIWKIDRFLNEL